MRKHISSLIFIILISSLIIPASAAESFSDIRSAHWAYTYVEQAHEKGWINGVGDGSFQPNANVTYAQMCVMLDQAFFSDKLAVYTGATQPWYAPYTNVAAQVGLLKGTNVEKAPTDAAKVNEPCSRMEMALILYNAMLASGGKVPTNEEQSAAALATPDVPYYENPHLRAIVVCKAAGIINGVDSKGTFAGQDNMTRAQAAVVMVKLDEYLNGAGSGTTNPGTTDPKPETPSNPTGGKDSNGYTLASGVKSSVGKSDSYPTKGRETTANRNGYFTAADVDIGDAQLVYELLDMVNEARRAEGLNELTWAPTDTMEEYMLLRAYELCNILDSHDRPENQYSFTGEAIARGTNGARGMFDGWMNSPGHRASIMHPSRTAMCAAKCGNHWIIGLTGEGGIKLIENGASVNYTKQNGWYDGEVYW